MHDNGYKEAEMVELYDAGVVIHTKDHDECSIGWSSLPGLHGANYWLNSYTVDDLLKFIGVKPRIIDKRDPATGENQQVYAKVPDLRIYKELGEICDGFPLHGIASTNTIQKLWVKIDAPQMLRIRMRYLYRVNEDPSDEYTRDQETTYCGTFKLWWPTEQENSDQTNAEKEEA